MCIGFYSIKIYINTDGSVCVGAFNKNTTAQFNGDVGNAMVTKNVRVSECVREHKMKRNEMKGTHIEEQLVRLLCGVLKIAVKGRMKCKISKVIHLAELKQQLEAIALPSN